MPKRVVYTKITPLPYNVPRQLAIELLHSHSEVIELNPLVTGVKEIQAPRDANSEEYFSTWYEIQEIITWGFGFRKKINFKGCFHDQPWGLQSHVYAPMGVDLRNKYRIGGNQPGEPREPRELGVDTPAEGLYLREDVEIVCNMALAGFVKKETIEATGKMIERLARKAELLDEGRLHAMFENGKLRTAKPSGFNEDERLGGSTNGSTPPASPGSSVSNMNLGPKLDQKGYGKYHDVARTASHSRPNSYQGNLYSPPYQQQGYNGPDTSNARPTNMPMIMELQGSDTPPNLSLNNPQGQVFRSELPGDTEFTTQAPSPRYSQSQAVAGVAVTTGEDTKVPTQQYQAYVPPPEIPARSAQRNSFIYTAANNNNTTISDWQRNTLSAMGNQPHNGDDMSSQYTESSTVSGGRDSMMTGVTTPEPPPSTAKFATSASSSIMTRCPVCDLFEGDEAAVTHHVSKSHFG
ncbi:uncharacterized protein RCC_10946 [Ramularia collo-cygni]|uniref:DUF7053 domain-containing protein n=1 Tax=Ramularia collo-cygni TaxID=112498 RepID=A0A2D3V4J7_9PEZI|nr:uncharacterized protein RCC_10946 [Ramularia collo-cygni]CZT25217.1 uncharacterized protein RCC_10946 [Ramularia collo-cygni]